MKLKNPISMYQPYGLMNLKKFFLFLLILFPLGITSQVNTGGTATTTDHNKQIIGYITNWDAWKSTTAGVPGPGALTHLNIDYNKYTILNYSFFGVARDGSLHSGDLRNKQIYQPGTTQEPGDIFFTDIYSSWDMHILFGEIDPIQYISQDAKNRAEAQGFEVEVNGTTWFHPAWGLGGGLPVPLHKETGAPGLLELAHQNGVKVMASIGGWSMCRHFPEMAADPVKRARFIEDCKKLIATGFDGIDLDWEYPGPYAGMNFTGSEADFKNFEILVQEIRNAIGPDKLITAAMSADPQKLDGFDWGQLAGNMDYFNMMTYDFAGGFSDKAGHNAPVYPYSGAEVSRFNWQSTFLQLKDMGVPSNKICMGAPFYGRGVVTDGAAELNAPTVKRAETVQPDGPIQTASDFVNWPRDVYDGTPNYFFIKQKALTPSSGWTRKWDNEAKVPYLVKDKYFLSYDDEESIGIKAQFINDNQLAGTIVWTVYGDLEISGSATSFGTKLKRWSNVKSPLINKINEVFAEGGNPDPNQLPSVSITSPSNNAQFEKGSSVPIKVNASDSDGTVTKVEFYNGTTKLGEDTSSPYEFVWNNISAGDFSITARATDNKGASKTSKAISIKVSGRSDCEDEGFKVVGYMPTWQGSADAIQYDKLTHINYSFLIPNADGSLQPLENVIKLQQIVSKAKAANVKVLIAVGGWLDGNDSAFVTLAANASSRTAFINNLVNFVNQYDLDGVDMDWEYPREGNEPQNFELLMQELGVAMHSRGKLLTAAVVVAGWNADGILTGVFDDVDFLNIMAYDGPEHGTMAQAQGGLDYWLGRGLPKSKAILGVPFYSRPQAQSFASLLAQGADPNSDVFQGNNYNGIPTIKQKTKLAKERAGGIMIWELSHDATGANSLLSAIREEAGDCNPDQNAPSVTITSPQNGASIKEDSTVEFTANCSDSDGTIASVLFELNGESLTTTKNGNTYSHTWNAAEVGTYVFKVTATDNDNLTQSKQISFTVKKKGAGNECDSYPEWVATDVYTGGMDVRYNDVHYQAKWWTQNQNPESNSGTDDVWKKIKDCSDDPDPTNISPTATITSPKPNDSFEKGTGITIEATATDTDGSVTNVQFFQGSILLGEDTDAPFTFVWNTDSLNNGTYELTAKATDNKGATGSSAVVQIFINATDGGGTCNEPSYVEGNNYVAGSKVQNEGKLYECKEYPYSGWCNGAAWAYAPGTGTYWEDAWILKGDCDDGGTGNPPTVSITAPTPGQSFTANSTITIRANSSDSDGSVTKVEFYSNGTKIGEDTTAPYEYVWNSVPSGNYNLMAKAMDDSGNTSNSEEVSISVGSTNPPNPGGDLPKRILVGYWHNFINAAGPMKLSDISDKWDVINVSFAIPTVPNGSVMTFFPDPAIYPSIQEFKDDVAALQRNGKKVLISMGGATGAVEVTSSSDAQEFSNSMIQIISEYGFDGMDIDFEGSSISLAAGDLDFKNPTSPKVVYLIEACRNILSSFSSDFILSMAPETLFVQGGFSGYAGASGAYLPLIYALRDQMDYIHVQHYNTGCMLGLDGLCYSSGNADFQVAMADMLLQGFAVAGGQQFPALRPDQVAIGLPANTSAAGSGYTAPAEVHKALDYIIKGESFGGRYTLRNPSGYTDFRGLMTWSINWDKASGFGFSNPHRTYLDGLSKSPIVEEVTAPEILVFPNPIKNGMLNLQVDPQLAESTYVFKMFDTKGAKVMEYVNDPTKESGQTSFDVTSYNPGIYFYSFSFPKGKINGKLIKQ